MSIVITIIVLVLIALAIFSYLALKQALSDPTPAMKKEYKELKFWSTIVLCTTLLKFTLVSVLLILIVMGCIAWRHELQTSDYPVALAQTFSYSVSAIQIILMVGIAYMAWM